MPNMTNLAKRLEVALFMAHPTKVIQIIHFFQGTHTQETNIAGLRKNEWYFISVDSQNVWHACHSIGCGHSRAVYHSLALWLFVFSAQYRIARTIPKANVPMLSTAHTFVH